MYIALGDAAIAPTMPGVKYPPPVKFWSAEMEKPTTGKGRENGVYYAMSNSIFKSLMQALPGYAASDIDSPGALKDANAIAWYEGMKNSFASLDGLLKTGGSIAAAFGPPTGPPPSGGTTNTFPGFKAAILELEKTLSNLQNKQAEMDYAATQPQAVPGPQPPPLAVPTPAAPMYIPPPVMYTTPQAPIAQPRQTAQAGMLDDISPIAMVALFAVPLLVQLLMRRR